MSLFVPYRRVTLLIPSGPAHDPNRNHLFILLTDPVPNSAGEKEVLLVSIATVRAGLFHDPACILYPGDHPFIAHESYVHYGNARIEDAQKLVNGVRKGILAAKGLLDGAIFARVCHGLTTSRHTVPKILAFYQEATA